ncbi:uncharacterized protein LOC118743853 [Rhagoletis pomonella]|uniref:uncharacterized protein LOC118743853 n=1 Tax=Rhagoletis pomonella TaxID=28610 RepID=UPI00177C3FA0|nr:uncharacterized protein LOC118743853 [Rhagoletis pomonella]
MSIFALIVIIFLYAFIVLPIFCFCTRIESKTLARLCPQGYRNCHRHCQRTVRQHTWRNYNGLDHRFDDMKITSTYSHFPLSPHLSIPDRQGNIFTIANEAPNNTLPHRCSDFFYVDPAAEDAARIRAQLEKDEKDLPTYEQVMAMSVAQTAAGTLEPYTASNTSIATTDTTVPPYSEIDRSVIHPAATANVTSSAIPLQTLNVGGTVGGPIGNTQAATGAASTSRAAAAAATSTPITVVTIANSVSNTSV